MKASHTIRPVFDDPNLVSVAGLVPVVGLAESAGLHDLLQDQLSVASANATAKATSVVGGMLAGADSIDDLDLLRHGGMPRLFSGVRAPSTLGTFLRSFTHGHVQQLDAIGADLLGGLTKRVPDVLAGGDAEGFACIDVDDTIREVHGYTKQAAAYGYTGVRGLNIQLATVSTPLAAPVIARARLRKGSTASAKGAGRLLAQAISTARAAGVRGQVLCRADSAYYGWAFVGTAIRAKTWFSVTARMGKTVTAAIASIEESTWRPIKYPKAVWDEEEQRWVSDAEVAEVPFVAFTGRRKAEHVTCRLIVRRVKRLQRLASDGTEQGELFATYRHHGFITNSRLGMVEADQRHRDHAIVEQVIAELKDGPLAHLPSGKYTANAAWVSLAVIAFNIARAAAVAADLAKARWATLRQKIIKVPGRIASTARRLDLHLPIHWPWAQGWESLHAVATGPPVAATS
ncbi:MAG TPA: IS1380 family transposase [Nocardioides sp.]|uniref:IS1380 family transposase n=1 Tax=Nocardioides sp. TaxID=35761 RepID=UPI002E34D38A|nr:IS1380 family transposase [Nocardioides sp.]HEX3932462.1 IS1380 family transposase [Nocardioides sp.]